MVSDRYKRLRPKRIEVVTSLKRDNVSFVFSYYKHEPDIVSVCKYKKEGNEYRPDWSFKIRTLKMDEAKVFYKQLLDYGFKKK
jgi:hypothetical protein